MKRYEFGWMWVFIGGAVFSLCTAQPASAARHHPHHRVGAARHHRVERSSDEEETPRIVSQSTSMYRGVLLEDADSGRVLYQYNADMEWPPASMAKMMLLLVASDEIRAGHCSLTDPVRISERSAWTGGSRVGLRAGDVYPLGELMKAALIKSANDAAVAIAEKVGGSIEGCVRMMNEKAQSLGMTHTIYNTVDGLPPRPGQDVDSTNAFDLATVGRALIHTTDLLQWSSMEQALFNDGTAILHNTNHLIGHFEGCDGLKTGFTFQAGFNLTATAKRGEMRLIAVVLGAPSNRQRFVQAAKFLQYGFDNFTKVAVLKEGEPLPVHVQTDSGGTIQPIAQSEVAVVVPKASASDIKLEYDIQPVVNAPLGNGVPLGEVLVLDGTSVLTRVAAVSPGPVRSNNTLLDLADGVPALGAVGAAPAKAAVAQHFQELQ